MLQSLTLHQHTDGGSSSDGSRVSSAIAEEPDDGSRDSSDIRKRKQENVFLAGVGHPSYFVLL